MNSQTLFLLILIRWKNV